MKINKEIMAKVNKKIAEKNYINRCFTVNVCPYCGQNIDNKKPTCSKNVEENCGRTGL